MKLNKLISALTATALTLSCVYVPSLSGISAENNTSQNDDVNYIPDFPKEILEEFGITWTGIASNVYVDNAFFDSFTTHNEFSYDGGYAMYLDQCQTNSVCFGANWHDCNSFSALQTKNFPLSEYTEDMKLKLNTDIYLDIKKSGVIKAGINLGLNSGNEEFLIIEKHTAETVFPEDEKLGSYTVDGVDYDLYKDSNTTDIVRYYAVNTEGITEGIKHKETLSLDLSKHFEHLRDIAGINTKLDSYGLLLDGEGGIGNIYFNAYLNNDFFPLPEEKLAFDENGDPQTYVKGLMKNLDGYRYSLQTFDSNFPAYQDEKGIYHFTENENNSYITPKGNGTFSAKISDGIISTVSSGKEFDGKTPLLDKDYHIDYEYTINGDDASKKAEVYASAWTLEPYVRLDFMEKSQLYYSPTNYLGTLELHGETYELYADTSNSIDKAPLGDNVPYKNYQFVHIDNGEADEVRKGSVPITELAETAKIYGVETGALARIELSSYYPKGDYTFNLSRNDITVKDRDVQSPPENSGAFVDVAKVSGDVNIQQYNFFASTKGYMYGYENGCFSAGSDGSDYSYFSSGKETSRTHAHYINSDSILTADYKVKNTYKDNYSFEYSLLGGFDHVVTYIHVIEKCTDVPEKTASSDAVAGNNNERKFIKSYIVNGHEYDLYKAKRRYDGDLLVTAIDNYFSIRKDQDDGEILEGRIDFKEHLRNIDDALYEGMDIAGIYLDMDTESGEGTFDALKNDIVIETKDIPNMIVGDFNNDKCIDSLDVIAAKKRLIRQINESDLYVFDYMDINGNGTFELADVVLLQSYVLGKIPYFDTIES